MDIKYSTKFPNKIARSHSYGHTRASQTFLFCDPVVKNKILYEPNICRLILC